MWLSVAGESSGVPEAAEDADARDAAAEDIGAVAACGAATTTKFDLIICNPPWIPGPAVTLLDQSVYDEESRFLQSFLMRAPNHLITSNDREGDGDGSTSLVGIGIH